MKVKNIRGTGDSSGSWLVKWKAANGYSPSDPIPCAVRGCTDRATDGAHVIKSYTGLQQFIVPMCHSHNLQYGKEFEICDWVNPIHVGDL